MDSRRPPHHENGFTLLEVLAALVLASLILVSLNLAMTAIGKGVDRTRASLGRQALVAGVIDVFGRDVARIAKIRRPGSDRFTGYVFEGRADSLIYPLREESGLASPGLYLVRLSIRDEGGQTQLVRERAPLGLGARNEGIQQWLDPVVLLSGPYSIAFAYRAQRSGARDWSDNWVASQTMPEQIRLTIADAGSGGLVVPGFVQPLRVDAALDCVVNPTPPCGAVPAAEATQ